MIPIRDRLFTAGLSPDLQTMEQIRRIMRPTDVPDTGRRILIRDILSISAFFAVGLLCDLLWYVIQLVPTSASLL